MIPSRGAPLEKIKSTAYNVLFKLKTGVRDIMVQAALEGVVLGVFDQFTREQLLEAISNDWDVWATAWGDFEEFRPQLLSLMADPVNQQVVRDLTYEDVWAWLRVGDARPDLASVIINAPNGVPWLRRQVDNFKLHLLLGEAGVSG